MPTLNHSDNVNKKEDNIEPTGVQFNIPTEIVQLPSKGLLYSQDSPLSSGEVEIKHMTTREEDIISTESYIKNNQVVEKLLKSLIQTKCRYNELLLGDRNAIMIAARIYGYGPDYAISIQNPSGNQQKIEVDLSDVGSKEIDEEAVTKGKNEFTFNLPVSGHELKFKLLTVGDEKQIKRVLDSKKKKGKKDSRAKKLTNVKSNSADGDPTFTTRLEHIILEVDGNKLSPEDKSRFVNSILARDARAFRNHYADIQPDVDLEFEFYDEETEEPFRHQVEIRPSFFYPDYEG